MDIFDHGYTRTPNGLLDKLSSLHVSGTKFNIIIAVFRNTVGFKRDYHELSASYLSKKINRNEKQVAKDVSELIKHKILIEVEKYTVSTSRKLAINYNYDEWQEPLTVAKLMSQRNTSPGGASTVNENTDHIKNIYSQENDGSAKATNEGVTEEIKALSTDSLTALEDEMDQINSILSLNNIEEIIA